MLCHFAFFHPILQGFYLTHQSMSGVGPLFKEIQEAEGKHLEEIDAHTPDIRTFRNYSGTMYE